MINSSTSWYKKSYPLRTAKFQQKLAENVIRKLSQSTKEIINQSINQPFACAPRIVQKKLLK